LASSTMCFLPAFETPSLRLLTDIRRITLAGECVQGWTLTRLKCR
jgi:hypothetical protein